MSRARDYRQISRKPYDSYPCRCSYKYRDRNGNITGYKLKDIVTGEEFEISKDDLKKEIDKGRIKVANLTLTTDKRLVDSSQEHAEPNGKHLNMFKSAHVIGVAEYMRERAKDYGLDPDLMYAVGLLHDIGYLIDKNNHELWGAGILKKLGVFDEVLIVVAHHGDNIRTLEKTTGSWIITPMLILMIESDMSVNAGGFRVGFEGRLLDIKKRYGEGSPAAINVEDNINYMRDYWKKHNIPDQSYLLV